MADVEGGREFRAGAVRAINLQQKIAEDGSAENADGESGDADAGREQDAAENDAEVIDDGREGRNDELAFGVLHRAEDAAFVKTDLGGEHDAGEEDDALAFGGIEAGGDEFDELGRENFGERDQDDEDHAHHGHHGGKGAPAFVFAFFGDVHGENRDESYAERAACDQIIQEIGESEGGVVGVGDGVGADLVGDGPFAEEPENAAEQHAGHDDAGGGGDAAVKVVGRRHVGEYGRCFAGAGLGRMRGVFRCGIARSEFRLWRVGHGFDNTF